MPRTISSFSAILVPACFVVGLLSCGEESALGQLTLLGSGPTLSETPPKSGPPAVQTFPIDTSWNENWIMGAAHTSGQHGSFFRTDLFIMAPCAGESGVIAFDLFSLPNDVAGNELQGSRSYSIPAGGFGIIRDVVDLFGQTGGATLHLHVNPSQSTATTACSELSSWGRTYTVADSGGEYSTGLLSTFPGILVGPTYYGAVAGVQQNNDRRTNVLIFNPLFSSITVRLYVFDHTGAPIGQKDVLVYGYSTTQVALSDFTILSPGGSIRAVALSGQYFQAQAVTVDNQTNDGYLNSFSVQKY